MRIVRTYPHPPEKIWRALTDPEVIPRWTAVGRGGIAVDFAPVVGTKFEYRAKPMIGWDGIVKCEVLEVSAPLLLRYTWDGDTTVTNRLEPLESSTRLTWEHVGFSGPFGFLVHRILLRVRKRMLDEGLPPVLDDL